MTREDVALFCNVNTHTVLEWIHHFNERGIDGLIEKLRSGSPRRISVAQVEKQIIPLLNKPSCVGQVHWTAIKLHGYLTNQMGALVSYSTLLRYLHERGYCQRIPRPMPEPPDKKIWQQQREAFAIQMKNWLQDPNVELWFSDESGVEGDPRPRKRWVMKGSKPEIPYAGKHLRRNIIGAVCPGNGLLSAVILLTVIRISFKLS